MSSGLYTFNIYVPNFLNLFFRDFLIKTIFLKGASLVVQTVKNLHPMQKILA